MCSCWSGIDWIMQEKKRWGQILFTENVCYCSWVRGNQRVCGDCARAGDIKQVFARNGRAYRFVVEGGARSDLLWYYLLTGFINSPWWWLLNYWSWDRRMTLNGQYLSQWLISELESDSWLNLSYQFLQIWPFPVRLPQKMALYFCLLRLNHICLHLHVHFENRKAFERKFFENAQTKNFFKSL